MTNAQIRSLASLDNVISSSRVLNLNKIYKKNRVSPEHRNKPLFSNRRLNRAIILKHRLRPSERAEFIDGRGTATKILFPLDRMEIKLGAEYLFVGQKNFERRLCEILQEKAIDLGGDIAILNLIDSIPSLDIYLLREFLERGGIKPADCYFENGATDHRHVQRFVVNEISTLAKMNYGSDNSGEKVQTLAYDLLSPKAAEITEELRQKLQIEKAEYRQCLFFWKAFLFYKWQIKKIVPLSEKIFREIRRVRPVGLISKEDKIKVENLKNKISYKFSFIFSETDSIVSIYDKAYNDFMHHGNAVSFRKFLLSAPLLFKELGESINDVAHIVNYWKFRPIKGHSVAVILEMMAATLMELDSMDYNNTHENKRA